MKKKELTFDEKLQRIQEIVEKLDLAEEPIDLLVDLYEEGMKLSAECRVFLESAESKIIDITNNYASE